MDNGTQFNNATVKRLCEIYNINIIFVPIYHSQANRMAEATNKAIVANMRKNLEEKRGNCETSNYPSITITFYNINKREILG